MLTISQQYHGLVNIDKRMRGKDLAEKVLFVCAYAYKLGSISERNLMNIIRYAEIPLDKKVVFKIIHFFFFSEMIEIRDENMGLVRKLESLPSRDFYDDKNFRFAKQEIEKMGRYVIDG